MSRASADGPHLVASSRTVATALAPAGQTGFGAQSALSVAGPPSLLGPWMLVSALWIASVFFFESRDGKIGQEWSRYSRRPFCRP